MRDCPISSPPSKSDESRRFPPRLSQYAAPIGHLPCVLGLCIYDRRGVPLVLLAFADLRETANLFACPHYGPGNLYARRGAIDIIVPERRGGRRLVYLVPIPLHHPASLHAWQSRCCTVLSLLISPARDKM